MNNMSPVVELDCRAVLVSVKFGCFKARSHRAAASAASLVSKYQMGSRPIPSVIASDDASNDAAADAWCV